MRTDWSFTFIFILIFVLSIAYGIANIFWAFDCGNRGGAYLIPQTGLPVCLQGVK